MFDLQPPRHISTLRGGDWRRARAGAGFYPLRDIKRYLLNPVFGLRP
jgi:hypothetical protein